MLIPGSSEQFVGRETELEQLSRSFDETQEGQGSIALVAGEPGIGKTVLINQLAEYASSNGANTLVGLCSEDEGAPPYWPWVQALRRYFEECDPDTLKDQLGTGGPLLAEAVPDIRSKLPELPQLDPDPNPESARFRLFDALEQFFHRAARAGPILLIFEDLHWADEPSMSMLSFVGQRIHTMPVLVIATYRDTDVRRQHPFSRVLSDIVRQPRHSQLRLRGWPEEDTAHFLSQSAGGGTTAGTGVRGASQHRRRTALRGRGSSAAAR